MVSNIPARDLSDAAILSRLPAALEMIQQQPLPEGRMPPALPIDEIAKAATYANLGAARSTLQGELRPLKLAARARTELEEAIRFRIRANFFDAAATSGFLQMASVPIPVRTLVPTYPPLTLRQVHSGLPVDAEACRIGLAQMDVSYVALVRLLEKHVAADVARENVAYAINNLAMFEWLASMASFGFVRCDGFDTPGTSDNSPSDGANEKRVLQ
jgi:hypothetical protein